MTQSAHVLLARNVHISQNKNKLLFVLNSSKTHDVGSPPQLIKISQKWSKGEKGKSTEDRFNPFDLICNYIHIRPPAKTHREQFFIFSDGTGVKLHHFRDLLKTLLLQLKLQPELYCVHGLRGGRACDLMKYGLSVETFKKLVR